MFALPEGLIRGVTHPRISALYFKKELGVNSREKDQDILVIETNFCSKNATEEIHDSYLMDLLLDLEDLKKQVEKKMGKFDRVDIKTH